MSEQDDEMSEQADSSKRLEVAVESNEKHRSRARAVSTLCAASAGALAAGLILGPSEAIPELAKILGLLAITLLIVATALGLAAGSASSYKKGDQKKPPKFWYTLEVWKVRVAPRKDPCLPETYTELIDEARAIREGISRILSWGLWSASFAAILLVSSLFVATFHSDSIRLVKLELSTPPEIDSCPDLGQVFVGGIHERDLNTNVVTLPVVVAATDCGNPAGATLFLDKSSVTIVG
ncbi:hypothetical protein ACTXJU_13590 [Glutamicibacter ardleyensis]|uniref:hypothetical protein n=1 Tax=Glutamicibacter ardleyensis TaxID=225894 RepID=UPI003FD649E6